MSHTISTMIGIRTGGVLSGTTDVEDLKQQIGNIIKKFEDDNEDEYVDICPDGLNYCMSNELSGTKGSFVVIAGVFNYWGYTSTSKFGKRLSKELGVEVMVTTWDEQRDTVQCDVFLDGNGINEVDENPITRTLRRVV